QFAGKRIGPTYNLGWCPMGGTQVDRSWVIATSGRIGFRMSVDQDDRESAGQDLPTLRQTIADLQRQVVEARRAGLRLAVRDSATGALSESSWPVEAAPRILGTVCETLQWQMGALWTAEPHAEVLRCVEVWPASPVIAPAFEAATRRSTFARGVGMPG